MLLFCLTSGDGHIVKIIDINLYILLQIFLSHFGDKGETQPWCCFGSILKKKSKKEFFYLILLKWFTGTSNLALSIHGSLFSKGFKVKYTSQIWC